MKGRVRRQSKKANSRPDCSLALLEGSQLHCLCKAVDEMGDSMRWRNMCGQLNHLAAKAQNARPHVKGKVEAHER